MNFSCSRSFLSFFFLANPGPEKTQDGHGKGFRSSPWMADRLIGESAEPSPVAWAGLV